MTGIAPQGGITTRRLDIALVGRELFALIRKDPVGTYGLAAALAAVPAVLPLLLTLVGQTTVRVTPIFGFTQVVPVGLWALAVAVIGLVIKVVLFGSLGWGAVQGQAGRTPTVADKFAAVGAAFLPAIGVTVLAYLGIGIGFVLLIVPGVFLALMWSMALLAAVVEGAPVFRAFSRSAELTRNHRWTIFLLLVIYFVIAIAVGVLGILVLRLTTGDAPVVIALVGAVFQVVTGGALYAVTGVGVGVVYHQLRALKGEFDPGRLNQVFG